MMKKIISTLAIALIPALTSPIIFANPIEHEVTYICPFVQSLSNFGSYIGGYGLEILSPSKRIEIYFKSMQQDSHVPWFLGNYTNYSANYDAPTGTVFCGYTSAYAFEKNFSIAYTITNGKGGRILYRAADSIQVSFLVGSH